MRQQDIRRNSIGNLVNNQVPKVEIEGKQDTKGLHYSLYQKIRDLGKLAAYEKLAGPIMEAKGEWVLARGGRGKSL